MTKTEIEKIEQAILERLDAFTPSLPKNMAMVSRAFVVEAAKTEVRLALGLFKLQAEVAACEDRLNEDARAQT